MSRLRSLQSQTLVAIAPGLVTLVFLLALVPTAAQNPTLKISTSEQIKQEFGKVPCKDEERLAAVKSLFEAAGAPSSDVTIDKHKNVENFVVTKKGESPEKIVVGAHYDKVADGCGAVDNWTGVVTLAHLYKTLKDVPLRRLWSWSRLGKRKRVWLDQVQ